MTATASKIQDDACQAGKDANQWQPIETCPRHVDVLFYREDAGVFYGQFTHADALMSDRERDETELSEEDLFTEDVFSFDNTGTYRCDGDLKPAQWMPLPQSPTLKSNVKE